MKNAKLSSIRLMVASLCTFCVLGLSAAQAQDRHVLVINDTSFTLVTFYASNIDQPGWQEDILGLGVLAAGRSINVNVDDGTGHCHYDLKAVFSNGQEAVRYNVNVCSVETWTIHD